MPPSSIDFRILPPIRRANQPILEPCREAPWASEMVLNPAIYQREGEKRIHMLFRASGPGSFFSGWHDPFPISLGYAWSDNAGESWTPDFGRPALTPRLRDTFADLLVPVEGDGEQLDYANGCIEDPRLFQIEDSLYLSVACRVFPPGPYWIHDDPMQCAPDWARHPAAPGGNAIKSNVTVSVLYRVEIGALQAHRYEEAFTYLGALTDPDRSDNRDVFLFPEKVVVGGRSQYLMVHRPKNSESYRKGLLKPTIFLSAADKISDFVKNPSMDEPLAEPLFAWEGNRVGGSSPPVRIDEKRWLLPYHGKQDDLVGYTQSFLILEEVADGLPKVRHRCSERVFFAREEWELKGKFPVPCAFTCGAIRSGGDLLMTYGAADTVCGAARVDWAELIEFVETFDANGRRR